MQQNHSININSKFFIDKIETDIVKLVQALSLEYRKSIDEAKIMARQIVQRRINQFLTNDELEGLKNLSSKVNSDIKNSTDIYDPIVIYELLKLMELN